MGLAQRACELVDLASVGLLPFACRDATEEAPIGSSGAGGSEAGQANAAGEAPGGSAGQAGRGSVAGMAGESGGGADGFGTASRCTEPMEEATRGVVSCTEDYVHRPRAVACGSPEGAGGAGGEGGKTRAPGDGVMCAQDEQRHAELAFRFLRWAVAAGDQGVEERLSRALEQLPATRPNIDVVRPCLGALLTRRPAA